MKFYLDTVGCRLNQAEIERYANQLRSRGHELVASPGEADLAVINTCAVTNAAESDSRQKIRSISRAGTPQIVVTGCWSTLKMEESTRLPGIHRVVPNMDKDELVSILLMDEFVDQTKHADSGSKPFERIGGRTESRVPIPGPRLKTRSFIKAQDGCNSSCTYCVTRLARGPTRSRPISDILDDIHGLSGSKEIILTGVHLGAWGEDFSPPQHLGHLVQAILRYSDVPRLRLSSLEPWDVDEEFFQLWENPRLCKHLHLPLQSGCSATLQRMARKTTPEAYAELIRKIRSIIPQIAITTDIITGFPGENEIEFQESLDFVRGLQFAGGHVFTYSPRPGTLAACMPNQVPYPVRKGRNALMQSVIREASYSYKSNFVNSVMPVLWERAIATNSKGFSLSGLTSNYLKVETLAPSNYWNQITSVHLTSVEDSHMLGRIIDQ